MRLRVIDLESCGLEPPAGICEIGWIDVVAGGRDLAGAPTDWRVDHMIARGDVGYCACVGGRTYSVVSVAGHSITATWSDTTRSGPRLGSAELPVGASYPRMSPLVKSIGETFASIAAAKDACERHRRSSTP